jgi:RNA polymerase-associated protein RTF1
MADLDAELLALAGGDESSDERPPSPGQTLSSPQPNRLPPHSHSPPDMGRKGTAKVVKKPKRRSADFDDDGEVYVSTSISLTLLSWGDLT